MGGKAIETLVGAVVVVVAIGFFVFAYNKSDVARVNGYTLTGAFASVGSLKPAGFSEMMVPTGCGEGAAGSMEVDRSGGGMDTGAESGGCSGADVSACISGDLGSVEVDCAARSSVADWTRVSVGRVAIEWSGVFAASSLATSAVSRAPSSVGSSVPVWTEASAVTAAKPSGDVPEDA